MELDAREDSEVLAESCSRLMQVAVGLETSVKEEPEPTVRFVMALSETSMSSSVSVRKSATFVAFILFEATLQFSFALLTGDWMALLMAAE